MNIYQKLIEVRKSVPYLKKEATGKQYSYTGSSQVLASVREKLDELGLLLITRITDSNLISSENSKGTVVNMTELTLEFTWVNTDNPEETIVIPFYAQGVDLAGEKGVGKALTYGEKYFMLKQFNIATDKDDPDAFQERAKTYGKPNPITSDQIKQIKIKVSEYAKMRNGTDEKLYKYFNIDDIKKLTDDRAKDVLRQLHGLIKKSEEEDKSA